jgi:hypothetical protein
MVQARIRSAGWGNDRYLLISAEHCVESPRNI